MSDQHHPPIKSIRVRYPMNEETWNKVVNPNGDEGPGTSGVVLEEWTDHFIVEYPSRAVLDKELARLEGLVEYRELAS